MAKLIRWTRRFNPAHPVPESVTLEALLNEYAAAGVSAIWNFAHAIVPEETEGLNEWNRRLGDARPEVVPFGTCHPDAPEPLRVIDRCVRDYGFVGMKFHPFVQRFVPWEQRFFPLWERLAGHGRIVVFHTGFETFYEGELPLWGFELILSTFPELVVVLAHANYPRVAEAFELLARHPNLVLDTVHVFSPLARDWVPPGAARSVGEELRSGLEAFPDRVLFGTDHPSGTGTLATIYRDVRAFGLSPAIEGRLLGENARRLVERVRRSVPATAAREREE
jgi:predicted TIM-barrel fold metal-dependent hydrolase